MSKKIRADLYLVENNYFKSRNKAEIAIREGKVKLNSSIIEKPGTLLNIEKIKNIEIAEKEKFVSRGGYKLEKALYEFNINVKNKICVDIGASTGGFTDCLLQAGAKKIYAVDVGYGQLDMNLRNNDKVILYERTNIKNINKSFFDEKLDIVVIDVSFISITKFLHNIIKFMDEDFSIVVLIKPQFESDRGDTVKGIVKDKKIHKKVLTDILNYIEENDLCMVGLTVSPIKGAKGNIEFLAHIKSYGIFINDDYIDNLLK